MKIAVIGRGLIGTAAARHLATQGHDVVLVGPLEPADTATHRGVFASHYDEGRITRELDAAPFWARVSRESIARYGEIEAASGVPFYNEVGVLMAGPASGAMVADVQDVAERAGVAFEACDNSALARKFPYFEFAQDSLGFHQSKNAGYISPRALVHAQATAAHHAGARFYEAVATGIDERADGVRVCSDQGDVDVDQVLVAAGGFSNMVLSKPLALTVFARTVALMEIDAGEVARLQGMPSFIELPDVGLDPYLLPPILYPDGKYYLKMGGDPVNVELEDADATKEWFRSGGNPDVADMLVGLTHARMPGLAVQSVQMRACVTTFSQSDQALIERVSARVSVAVAGCGRGAKCSDELGRLGGEVALGRDLPDWARPQ